MLFETPLSPALGIELTVDCYIFDGILRRVLHYQGKMTSECELRVTRTLISLVLR